MKTNFRHVISLLVFFLLGYAAGYSRHAMANEQRVKPAYVVVSAESVEPDKMGPYREKALPLARHPGMKVLAHGLSGGAVEVLEGEWPYKGTVLVQKYDSMDALLSFWNSPEYQAKKLREGFLKSNFMIAMEATN